LVHKKKVIASLISSKKEDIFIYLKNLFGRDLHRFEPSSGLDPPADC